MVAVLDEGASTSVVVYCAAVTGTAVVLPKALTVQQPYRRKPYVSLAREDIVLSRYLLKSSGKIFAKIEWKDTSGK